MGSENVEEVVIPAINTASSTAAIRSLGKKGIKTIAVSEHGSPPGFRSTYCNERIAVPNPRTDLAAYEDALLELARRENVKTILPFREPDIYALARNRDAFAEHVGAPWPSLETLRRVQDRVELFEAARAADVAVPRTELFDSCDDWDRNLIVKPRYTVHATEYADAFTPSETQHESTRYVARGSQPDRDTLLAEMGHVPIVQECIPTTDEYAFFAQYKQGTPVATFQHRQVRGRTYAGGFSVYRESVEIPELEAAGRRLLDELDWHGVAMVEFLRDPRTGEFKLMEINPRFWSSLPFTVQAGVDFPSLYWKQATGRPIDSESTYQTETAGHLLRGELLHLHSIAFDDCPLVERPSFSRTVRDIGESLVRHPRFDYLDRDDPGPFLQDVVNTGKQVGGLIEDRLPDLVIERFPSTEPPREEEARTPTDH